MSRRTPPAESVSEMCRRVAGANARAAAVLIAVLLATGLSMPAARVPAAPPAAATPHEFECDGGLTRYPKGEAVAAEYIGYLEKHLAVALNPILRVCLSTTDDPTPNAIVPASTIAKINTDGTLDCRTTIYPVATKVLMSEADRAAVVAHEMMHCFERRFSGSAPLSALPRWVAEGIAEWAAFTVATERVGVPGNTPWWKEYLTDPEKPLIARQYDAVAFFYHVDGRTHDLWQRIPGIVAKSVDGTGTRDDAAAFREAVRSPGDDILGTWAPSWLVDPKRGGSKAWDLTGVSISADRALLRNEAVTNGGGPVELASVPFAAKIEELDLQADVVVIGQASGPAYGRFGPGASGDYALADAYKANFCTKGKQCKCPDGTPQAGTDFTRIDRGTALLAVTGGDTAASVRAFGVSLDDFCGKQKPKPTGGRRGQVPTACPNATVIAAAAPGSWEYVSEILPPHLSPGYVTCGYDTVDTPTQFMEVYLGAAAEDRQDDAQPVDLPGVDRAWRWGMGLYAVVDGRTLIVSTLGVTGDPEATVRAVADSVLGLRD